MAKLGLAPHLSIAADADGDDLPDVLVSSGYYRDGVGKIYAFPYCSFME
jgi:hypothetical protein